MYSQQHAHPLQQHRGYQMPPMPPLAMPPAMVQPGSQYPLRTEPVASPAVEDPGPPRTVSQIYDNKIWTLKVEQQPIRARMCGFGDKDRRPITPPPCIKLSVTDALTHKEVDMNDIDTSFFVLTVDLWDEPGRREVNLVRHAAQSPSISSATSASFSATSGQQSPAFTATMSQSQAMYSGSASAYAPTNGYYSQVGYQHHPSPYGHNPQMSALQPYQMAGQNGGSMAGLMTPPQGMFTRNLIGSLSASAFRLNDPDEKNGIWFILQDLSVRTEGTFRLKVSFVNVGTIANGYPQDPNRPYSTTLNMDKAPVLSTTFTEPFQVFSAKKFPGVIESTGLSKCFAQQGIKIPIRKDGLKGGKEEEEDDY